MLTKLVFYQQQSFVLFWINNPDYFLAHSLLQTLSSDKMNETATSIYSVIISVVTDITVSQEDEHVINEHVEEEWTKWWDLWYTTIHILLGNEFIIHIHSLHYYYDSIYY